ncbi:hypothetical protein Mapa_016036 [Marchantia paleacea]|nr:hypothetical protein Mapa_016036 [Marchantia paleacea]
MGMEGPLLPPHSAYCKIARLVPENRVLVAVLTLPLVYGSEDQNAELKVANVTT